MTSKSAAISDAIQAGKPHEDGRRERSRASRRAIVKATMDLMAEGDINPSAARVAERAGVGRRSVFRHFDDKESLYREIDAILTDAYAPRLFEPYLSDDWRLQLGELIERRARVYEEIAPFRIATSIQRFRSPVLMENYRRMLAAEHNALMSILPARVRKDEKRTRAILLATSFDSWRLFRQDEELSLAQTTQALRQLLDDILDQIEE